MELIIGIATCGRKELLQKTVADIARQSEPPERIIIAPITKDLDVGELTLPKIIQSAVSVVEGPAGASAQRNTILKSIGESKGVILFLDDDFVMHKDYCRELRNIYVHNPEVVGTAGNVIADGINTAGIDFDNAVNLVEDYSALEVEYLKDNGTTYGCNMAFRSEVIRKNKIFFDENLPMYSWFEDLDFSSRVSKYGRVVIVNRCAGVHLGQKSGRTSGVKLGYSQVVNPFYMWRKGTMSFFRMFISVGRRVIANIVRSACPEPWVDRRGRFQGNTRGILDILRGRSDPKKILNM